MFKQTIYGENIHDFSWVDHINSSGSVFKCICQKLVFSPKVHKLNIYEYIWFWILMDHSWLLSSFLVWQNLVYNSRGPKQGWFNYGTLERWTSSSSIVIHRMPTKKGKSQTQIKIFPGECPMIWQTIPVSGTNQTTEQWLLSTPGGWGWYYPTSWGL